MTYEVPEIFKPKQLVESERTNKNNKYITDNLENLKNQVDNNTLDLSNKIDINLIGSRNGLATLDDSGVLTQDQIPETTLTHTFIVESLVDMLSLSAQPGDWCKRLDIGKSFILTSDTSNQLNGWVEMGSISINNILIPLPPYVIKISEEDWIINELDNLYEYQIAPNIHKQNYLGCDSIFVCCYDEFGNNLSIDYVVDEYSFITIKSNISFVCKIIVSNLSNSSYGIDTVPNSIISSYMENNENKFLSITSDGKIDVSFDKSLVIINSNRDIIGIKDIGSIFVEGFDDNVPAFPYDVSNFNDGLYHVFINSNDISNSDKLNQLLLIRHDNYYNKSGNLPIVTEESIYIDNDGAQLYAPNESSWIPISICHIGEVAIKDGLATDIYNDDYNQNGYNVNVKSVNKDYLAKGLTPLDLQIKNNSILINCGEVLLNDKSRIIDLSGLSLNITNIDESDLSWFDLYVLSNNYNDSELRLINHNSILDLGHKFSSYCKLTSLISINNKLVDCQTINNFIYLDESIDLLSESCYNGVIIESIPNNIKNLVCCLDNDLGFDFNFGIQEFITESVESSKNYTAYEVSMENGSDFIFGYVDISGDIDTFIPDKTLIYVDKELNEQLAISEGNDFKWTGESENLSKIEITSINKLNGPITNSLFIKNKQTVILPYKNKLSIQGGNQDSNLNIKLLGYEF